MPPSFPKDVAWVYGLYAGFSQVFLGEGVVHSGFRHVVLFLHVFLTNGKGIGAMWCERAMDARLAGG